MAEHKKTKKIGQKEFKRISQFLFEVGTKRKILRMHRQTLLTDDMSDNIASHSYRVALIGWHLAMIEGLDASKVTLMCLLHDIAEIRTGDHNWVHKRYVKIYEEEAKQEQLGTLPFGDFKELLDEYDERKTPEAIVAKDADLLDQVLLLKEYAWQGNKEAPIWLHGKPGESNAGKNKQLSLLKTESARSLGEAIVSEDPSSWWNDLWTSNNR